MKLTVNGNVVTLEQPLSIQELLAHQKVNMPDYVTVQLNDEFIDRSDFPKILVQENDVVDFLYFMGGGK